MPLCIAIVVRRAVCPRCGCTHGLSPWERSYWLLLASSLAIVDGGPVLTLPLVCPRCQRGPGGGQPER